ncbi:hypothetical protein MMC20_006590 [Loxospora ochrophaea]|nr:hypothetical protein [Loxospora ochrophaea]
MHWRKKDVRIYGPVIETPQYRPRQLTDDLPRLWEVKNLSSYLDYFQIAYQTRFRKETISGAIPGRNNYPLSVFVYGDHMDLGKLGTYLGLDSEESRELVEKTTPARLPGYDIYSLRTWLNTIPACVPSSQNAYVEGFLLYNLTQSQSDKLDSATEMQYGGIFKKKTLTVEVIDSKGKVRKMKAAVYRLEDNKDTRALRNGPREKGWNVKQLLLLHHEVPRSGLSREEANLYQQALPFE